jgi:succinate dehydrogenase / fumarate reductase cytochrome b subunit
MTFNVNDMMIGGFHVWWVSAFYIIATGLLCMHLTHGVSSMFQTVGLRNQLWRARLDRFALIYGVVVFLGFAVIPVAAMTGILKKTAPAVEAGEVIVEQLHQ